MKENWRDVPGYEGLYQITVDGEVRCRRFYKNGKVKILSNKPNVQNRINWGLCKNGKETVYQAAKWVAITFPELLNEYFDGAVIDHKDTNPINNHPSNLHWVSQKDNCGNPLTKKHMSEAKICVARPDKYKRVAQYTLDGKYVNDYPSVQAAAEHTGSVRSSISSVLTGKRKTHKGYKWKYIIIN